MYNIKVSFLIFGGKMVIEKQEEKLDVLEKASEEGSYKPIYPLPQSLKKKKKKKKKLFPTDPDDPETDDDFDEEDDDDDDDTESDADSDPDTEDENELKQEEQKPQSFFKNPFFMFKRHENMALKKGPNPEKQQRSPVQKFIDVLLYGVEGARIKNGELPKQSITDELLLGLGFKAYLKDVLLGRQAAKYWKQKMGGKENISLLKTGLKGLKKQAVNDPSARVLIKEVQKGLKDKTLKLNKERVSQQQQLMEQQKQSVELNKPRPQPVPIEKTSVDKQPIQPVQKEPEVKARVSGDEMRQILLKTEQEEKRILKDERREILQRESINEKVALMEKRVQENKQEQVLSTQKNVEMTVAKKAVVQNDKDQLLMQREEMQMQRSQQNMDMSALQNASRMAAMQLGAMVRNNMDKVMPQQGLKEFVQRGMAPIDREIAAIGNAVRNLQGVPGVGQPPIVPPVVKDTTPPAPVQAPSQPNQQQPVGDSRNPQPEPRQPDVAGAIAGRAVHVIPEGQVAHPTPVSERTQK